MLFGKKEKKAKKVEIDYRMSGYELMRMLFIITVVVLVIGWSSILLLSLLYFLSFASLMVLLVYGREADKKGVRYGKWFFVVLAVALFFFAFSLNSNNWAYLVGAYGSSLSSPVFAYFMFLRDLKAKREIAEVFGYE